MSAATVPTKSSDSQSKAALYQDHPIFGSLFAARKDPLGLYLNAANLGPIVEIKFPFLRAFLVREPDLIHEVLVQKHEDFDKSNRGYRVLREFLGQGLLTIEGEVWRRHRQIMNPIFQHARIRKFFDVFANSTQEKISAWMAHERQEIDVSNEMMALTLTIVGRSLLGEISEEDIHHVDTAMKILMPQFLDRTTNPFYPPKWIPTPKNREHTHATVLLRSIVARMIEEGRKTESGSNLMSMLLSERNEEGRSLNDTEVRDELLTLMLAGHETTANTLSFTLALLAQHPNEQLRVQNELDEILGSSELSVHLVDKLPMLEACLKESIRLYPPAWLIARGTKRHTKIGNVAIPKGSVVFTSPWATHRQAHLFPDPLKFLPDRFLSGEVERAPKGSYFPFGVGPRICIGNGFAMMEAKVILAELIRHFEFTLSPHTPIELELGVTLRVKPGLRLQLKHRKGEQRTNSSHV